MDYQDICRLFRSFSGRHIYVGYSGGADSLAALLAARYAAAESGSPLTAVHFEHGLRGAESLQDAEHCRNQCRAWNVDFLQIPLQVPAHTLPGESPETAARRLRLEAWRNIAGGTPQNALIVLGHHRDDAAENFFLRLARGAGIGGILGLQPISQIGELTFLRPLLPFTRREIEDFLRQNGIQTWCSDRTNAETEYRRNFIRHKLLPLFKELHPGAASGLDASISALEEAADFLNQETEKRLPDFINSDDWAIQQWTALPAALQMPILQKVISHRLGRHWIPRRGLLLRLRAMLQAPQSSELRLLILPDAPELQIHFRNDRLNLVQTLAQTHNRMWRWRENDDILLQAKMVSAMPEPGEFSLNKAYFDAEKLPEELWIADAEDGERMRVYGGREVKWKKLRIDRGIDRKNAAPLLRKPDGTILWSPGIRHGAEASVDAKTVHIVEFTYKEQKNGNSKTDHGTGPESHA